MPSLFVLFIQKITIVHLSIMEFGGEFWKKLLLVFSDHQCDKPRESSLVLDWHHRFTVFYPNFFSCRPTVFSYLRGSAARANAQIKNRSEKKRDDRERGAFSRVVPCKSFVASRQPKGLSFFFSKWLCIDMTATACSGLSLQMCRYNRAIFQIE